MKTEELVAGIYEIKNFISNDSCKFLIESLEDELIENENQKNIFGTLGSINNINFERRGNYNNSSKYNIALDFFNNIFISIPEIVSKIYNERHVLKQTYYSCMNIEAFNPLHVDNYEKDENGKWVERANYGKDKSAILYLNNNYFGGELNFPKQNLKLKLGYKFKIKFSKS